MHQNTKTKHRRVPGLALALGLLVWGGSAAGIALAANSEHLSSAAERIESTSVSSIPEGNGTFAFSEWAGPTIPVWTYVPDGADPRDAPILFVMHGAKREPQRYLSDWIEGAQQGGFIIIAPEFSRAQFSTSRYYNLGGVFDRRSEIARPEEQWAFSAIEPLFDEVVERLGGKQTHYTLYGHSAGSQFVHRFLMLKPNARVKRFLAANAGWYTFADPTINWPFGLAGAPSHEGDLRKALAKDVVILLGDQDSDPNHESLNRSDGAMRQGPHRFARGQAFFSEAQTLAQRNGWEFGWSLRVIPGVAHSNGGIAKGAFDLVE
jgi:hypothetical protein